MKLELLTLKWAVAEKYLPSGIWVRGAYGQQPAKGNHEELAAMDLSQKGKSIQTIDPPPHNNSDLNIHWELR